VKTLGIILTVYDDGLEPQIFDGPANADRDLQEGDLQEG
jgi:hypothetical protein